MSTAEQRRNTLSAVTALGALALVITVRAMQPGPAQTPQTAALSERPAPVVTVSVLTDLLDSAEELALAGMLALDSQDALIAAVADTRRALATAVRDSGLRADELADSDIARWGELAAGEQRISALMADWQAGQ